VENQPKKRRPVARANDRNRQKKTSKKTSFAIFYAITMIVGVVVCVTLFAVGYNTLVAPRIRAESVATIPTEPEVEFVRAEYEQFLGMITDIDRFAPGGLTIHLIESGRNDRFAMSENTSVVDRRGFPMGFGELALGHIVQISVDPNTGNTAAVALSAHAWEIQPSNFNIDLNATTITVGNRVYGYNSNILVLNQGEPTSIALVGRGDSITMRGIDDTVWSVRVDTSTGFIRFDNANRIVEPTVTVGNFIHTTIEPGRLISVPEGLHRVIVNGQNIDTFARDVVVRQGETVGVDLAVESSLRQGTLQLILNEPNASVFLNGMEVQLENTMVEVEFGEYVLRVEADGFLPIQEDIIIEQPFTRLDLNLERDTPAETAVILIETFPSGALISVGDFIVGNSPVSMQIHHGSHTITAQLAGHEERSLHIVVDQTSQRQYLIPLTQIGFQPQPPPALTPTPMPTMPPGGQQVLPPISPEVTPIPSPTIPAELPTATPDTTQPLFPPTQTPMPTPIPTPDLPSIDDLPLPDEGTDEGTDGETNE